MFNIPMKNIKRAICDNVLIMSYLCFNYGCKVVKIFYNYVKIFYRQDYCACSFLLLALWRTITSERRSLRVMTVPSFGKMSLPDDSVMISC